MSVGNSKSGIRAVTRAMGAAWRRARAKMLSQHDPADGVALDHPLLVNPGRRVFMTAVPAAAVAAPGIVKAAAEQDLGYELREIPMMPRQLDYPDMHALWGSLPKKNRFEQMIADAMAKRRNWYGNTPAIKRSEKFLPGLSERISRDRAKSKVRG